MIQDTKNGKKLKFQTDQRGKYLYINGKKVITQKRITLNFFERATAISIAISSVVMAVFDMLTYFKKC